MKKLRLAFLYNVRHIYPDINNPQSQIETDYDDQPAIDWMVKHLQSLGHDVLPVEANQEAYLKLYENKDKIDLVFNYSMGLYGLSRYAHLPAMLEMLKLPYTGSDPLTQALVMNKARMQEVLSANGVPTLLSQVFSDINEPLRPELKYPLIVKPVAQGSSAGITSDSVVKDDKALRRQLKHVMDLFKEPAVVQPFLTGREFSVPLLGNPPEVLPFIEPDFSQLPSQYLPLDSLEVKWDYEENAETNHLVCPAKVTPGLKDKITAIVLKAFKALNLRDFCRIDLRMDTEGNAYVLDINSPAGLVPPESSMTSYFPLSARAVNLTYPQLLQAIIDSALKRLK